MAEPIKYLPIKTFQEDGYLQEANRLFFHPLGLALEVDLETEAIRVWDFREDPEGIRFDDLELREKHDRLKAIAEKKKDARIKALGYFVQPVEPSE